MCRAIHQAEVRANSACNHHTANETQRRTPKGCRDISQGEAAERRHPWLRTVRNPGTPMGCQDKCDEANRWLRSLRSLTTGQFSCILPGALTAHKSVLQFRPTFSTFMPLF